jgi:NADH-quinone oxidoreductase subunit E
MSNELGVAEEQKLDLGRAEEICREHEGRKGDLLVVLQKIQAVYGYVPKSIFPLASQYLGASSSEIFGVLTFYNRFHLSRRGKHTVRACRGTACHFKNSLEILEKIRSHLHLAPNQDTTDDAVFSIEEVACLGACGIAPVMTVDDEVFGKLSPEQAVKILSRYETNKKDSEE